jgi:hypothetical protein
MQIATPTHTEHERRVTNFRNCTGRLTQDTQRMVTSTGKARCKAKTSKATQAPVPSAIVVDAAQQGNQNWRDACGLLRFAAQGPDQPSGLPSTFLRCLRANSVITHSVSVSEWLTDNSRGVLVNTVTAKRPISHYT